jgi:hypothetical protein
MNSPHYHAVIWVDHREARVFHLSPTDVDRLVLHPDHPTKHIHHKANSIGSGHAQEDRNYFQAISKRYRSGDSVTAACKGTELIKHHQHNPRM